MSWLGVAQFAVQNHVNYMYMISALILIPNENRWDVISAMLSTALITIIIIWRKTELLWLEVC